MSKEKLILSILSADRHGVVQEISDTILASGGNWLESSLSRLGGQFAGIVRVEISAADKAALVSALSDLQQNGITVSAHQEIDVPSTSSSTQSIDLIVEANDRPGIVEEISSALAEAKINVEHIETSCMSASMAGYQLFVAELVVALPSTASISDLEQVLEDVSDDLVVTVQPE